MGCGGHGAGGPSYQLQLCTLWQCFCCLLLFLLIIIIIVMPFLIMQMQSLKFVLIHPCLG